MTSRMARIEIRCTAEERDRWQAHAERDGRTLSQLVRLLVEGDAEFARVHRVAPPTLATRDVWHGKKGRKA
jgi:hypothetical protein